MEGRKKRIIIHILKCVGCIAIIYPAGLIFATMGASIKDNWLWMLIVVLIVVPLVYCLYTYKNYKSEKQIAERFNQKSINNKQNCHKNEQIETEHAKTE